ncbi:plasma-membrane proton-e [Coccomyxa subellipsoidea C-169]|uniref:Plasma membrane ATPase n=1 Tax=Coccomyxa subellipsoidea (strain C-169) TaxID=574566 RepID=I0YZ69_COCSC|nr:plasma-membrane proton-e [Coccomyxa subellipsoidea C-169]EIE23688.1 plasma-membrane proton-e [Coccomyxa subellipsoidea C-169]|eukprot:XP_005648232.1 plasma-membrane proton-e [Coccomyxa subellipsoidea C-169]
MGQMGKHLERVQPMGTQTAMVSHLQIPCSPHTPTLAASPPPVYGRNELEERTTSKLLVFLKLLVMPMPIMIWLAVIVEAAIGNWLDMIILLLIQFVNASIGWYETTKASDAVKALKASLKPQATVCRDGCWQVVDGSILVPGDLVLLGSGAHIPADCRVKEGTIDVDQSALTGESLPVTLRGGDAAQMGATVTGKNTFFGRTATLLQSVENLGNLQRILMRVVIVLLVLSVLLCAIALIYLLARGEGFRHALGFIVVLLVASIPIAIEIVSTTTLALGSRQLAAQGAIVTRLTAIEEMAGMTLLCSDKTGTLTLNQMVIQEDCPLYAEGEDRHSVLQAAAAAAKWWEPPRDALDSMVLKAAALHELEGYTHLDFTPFDPAIKRTEATVQAPDGSSFKVTKGAAHAVLSLIQTNTEVITSSVNQKVQEFGHRGIRCMAVARTDAQGQWQMLGLLTFLDPPRPDTRSTLETALRHGVQTRMITGDNMLIARETARALGMGTDIRTPEGLPSMTEDGRMPPHLGRDYAHVILPADGFAQVYPEHKYLIVEALRQLGYSVGMTGDGVNDAPALKRADVGIAVSGATDAARASADIVLTEPGLSTIVDAIVIARRIFRRISNFLNYRIAATLQLLLFFFIAVFAFAPHDYNPRWPSFFQLPVLMLMLITLLNDGTLISIGYDNVVPNPRPDRWNLRVIFTVASVLGSVACLSSLLLLWACLESGHKGSLFRRMHLPPIPYAKIITMLYLKVSISDFLTLFSSRTTGFFWTSPPAPLLTGAAIFSLALSTLLACVWPAVTTDRNVPVRGLCRGGYKAWPVWVWLYCLVWWLIQDTLKVLTYKLLFAFDIFQIKSGSRTGKAGNQPREDRLLAVHVTPEAQTELTRYTHAGVQHEVEAGLDDLRAAYAELHEQLDSAARPPEEKERLAQHLQQVRHAASSLERVAGAMARQAAADHPGRDDGVRFTVGPVDGRASRDGQGDSRRRSH